MHACFTLKMRLCHCSLDPQLQLLFVDFQVDHSVFDQAIMGEDRIQPG